MQDFRPPALSSAASAAATSEADRLTAELYQELRRLAAGLVRRYRPGQTVQPTMLVHEAYLKLARTDGAWSSPKHFYAVAARAMRSILVDYVRAKRARKRQPENGRVLGMDQLVAAFEERAIDLVVLHDALDTLAAQEPILAERIELRFFAGLSAARIAELAEVSKRTVERDLQRAREWLAEALQ